MKVLVVGGSAFFGVDIVNALLKIKADVTVLNRGNHTQDYIGKVTHLRADRTNLQELKQVLKGQSFDILIDNIAFNAADVRQLVSSLDSRVGHYILTSTCAVYHDHGAFDMPVKEENASAEDPDVGLLQKRYGLSPVGVAGYPEGVFAYGRDKLAAEHEVMASGIHYTILRLPNVMGPRDTSQRITFYLSRLLDEQPLILTNGGLQLLQPVFSFDVAKAYVTSATSPQAVNQVFNLAQHIAFRLVDWLLLCCQELGRTPRFVSIPEQVLDARLKEYGENATFTSPFLMNTEKARLKLGFKPTPVEIWTKTITDWFKTVGPVDMPDREREVRFANDYLSKVEF
ncbi:NAD-dependent epimerase/dehydratase family protein [Grimontia sp. NTOU-MAR1]|uniref:NAD-dependent epimerase/dehydratase family protein n=1 Tax=Grimontia sp. NTOU-MAR1 TaxID=3111011 RepID=UPI002DBCCC6C|nr:NAD-dependent epimerase/dehydratase family protein [Grimontia sp. NTOU-MAR1]WRV98375.1 NAD-dependent epimerase/dehydratase family protein [Grimontia sp. NTOU-MAR1]